MKKNFILKLCLGFCLLVFIIFSFNSLKSYADSSLTKYKIDINFDETAKTLKSEELITYTNNYNTPLNNLVLHLYPDSYKSVSTLPVIGNDIRPVLKEAQIGSITINEVTIDNKPITFTSDNQILKFNLDAPLNKGASVNIKISFTVKIPSGDDRLGYINDVYSITNWYPLMSIYDPSSGTWDENKYNPVGESNYSDCSDYDITLTTPKNIITASTGTVSSERISGGSKTIIVNAHKVRDFVFMMSKYYKIISATVDGVKINSYYIYNDSSKDTGGTAKTLLDVVCSSEKFYSKSFGKYPYPELNLVETYLSGGAMEYPALIQMGKYQPMTENEIKYHSSWLEDAAAHETGHQWWYVAIGNNEFKEPMMDESINTFATAYYFEKTYGKYTTGSTTMKIRNNLVTGKTMPINSSVDKFSSWEDYQTTIYQRGPEIFEDLRTRLGDAKFLEILQTYFSRFEFKNGSIKDFANVIGEISNSATQTYFEQAINEDNYYPNNLLFNATDKKHLADQDIISDLQLREDTKGLTIGSILLRGLQGENLNVVIPSKLSASEGKVVNSYVNNLKANCLKLYDLKVNIIKDDAITSKQLGENLIVLGNFENNKVLKSDTSNLPLKISTTQAIIKNYTVSNKNLSGMYLIKNPKNTKNLLLVVYWKDALYKYDFFFDNMDQFIINYGKGAEVRGQL